MSVSVHPCTTWRLVPTCATATWQSDKWWLWWAVTGWLGPPHLLLQIWAQIGPHTLTRQQENSAEKELFFSLYFLSPLWSYTLYSLSRTFFFHIYLCYFVCFYCLFSPCFLSPYTSFRHRDLKKKLYFLGSMKLHITLSHCCIAVVAKLNNCSMPSSASYTHTVNWVKFSGCKKQCVGVAKWQK